jgi:protein-disulfide isomerase
MNPSLAAVLRPFRSLKGAAAAAALVVASALALSPTGPASAGVASRAQTIILAQASPAPSQPASAPVFTPEQKSAIEKIVKDYFMAHPEAMLDIQNALEAKMEKIQADKLKTALKENAAEIYKRPGAPVAGNPNGDITVVEFFDYNCGYCKRAFTDMSKLVEKDSKIKLVLKELPILSKGSEEAARIALAAKMQGKYWEAHRALITVRGEINEQSGLKAVEKLGLDMTRLKRDMESPEVKAEIGFVRDLAQKMGIQGTPHFLVGDRAIPGAPSNLLEQITSHVSDLRKNGCSVC